MTVDKTEKAFNVLFKKLYGETFYVSNAIKVNFDDTEVSVGPGGRIIIHPQFTFLSTLKSFETKHLTEKLDGMCDKVVKYLNINCELFSTVNSLNTSLYFTEEDMKLIDNVFLNLTSIKIFDDYDVNIGELSIKPLYWETDMDMDGFKPFINFVFFVKGGQIQLKNQEIVLLPTHKDEDIFVMDRIQTSYSPTIVNLLKDISKRFLSQSDVEYEGLFGVLSPKL